MDNEKTTMLRALLTPVVALLMCGPASAGPQEDCNQSANHALRIQGCTEIARQNPRDAVAYYRRGMANAATRRDFEKAIADFSKAIEIDPNYAESFNERGIAYREMKDYNRAIADQTKAIEINPRFARAYNSRGNAYHEMKDYARAIADTDKAIEVDPSYARAYNARGFTYQTMGEFDRALTDYTKAIEIDPK